MPDSAWLPARIDPEGPLAVTTQIPATTQSSVTVRDAHRDEFPAAADTLTAAFHDGAVLSWAEPDPAARNPLLQPYFTGLLAHAATHGTVRVAETPDGGGAITAVAIWFAYPLPAGVTDVHDLGDPDLPPSAAAQRLGQLENALQSRHPTAAHYYLAYLGVHPTAQNHGLGSHLLHDQLAILHDTGTPAYLEASHRRNRALYQRHGFTDLGPHVSVDGCPRVYPMWWSPDANTSAR